MSAMIGLVLLALQTGQPEPASDEATQGPRSRFIICPRDTRCPRSASPMLGGLAGGLGTSITPNYGSVVLQGGFSPDPRVFRLRSGGTRNAAMLSSECEGYVSPAPDLRLSYSATTHPLTLIAAGRGVSLLINGPDGRWYCTPAATERVVYRFERPQSGRYDVWVGAPRGGGVPVELRISELPDAAGAPTD